MRDSVAAIRADIEENLFRMVGRFPEVATRNDYYLAVAYTVRDRILHRWARTAKRYFDRAVRTVCYFSAEFLIGPQLGQNLLNLGILDETRQAVGQLGLNLDDLLEQEEEPGLGNGGLGRLAACYLDSLATLEIPTIGYGIRYEFGIFDQDIRDGRQVERSDRWLRLGYPWEVARPEITFEVKLGGRTETYRDATGRYCVRWIPDRIVLGTPCDTLVQGYRVGTVNMLRLWKAEATNTFDFQAFNVGDYYRAVVEKMQTENITKVLYPNDEAEAGKQLRLEQQYFFTSCSLQDMIRIYLQRESALENLPRKYAVQLNDTHPALAVAELMRLLIDEHGLDWDRAWAATQSMLAYTNHTLMSEALEKWPLTLFGRLLPRPLEIIFEINRRFLCDVRRRFPNDVDKVRRLSLIEEGRERRVRMAHLACVGSRSVNGVAELHTRLLKETVLRDFHDLWPEKFNNKTNGVSPRRFLAFANPQLAALLDGALGPQWINECEQLRNLERFADDPAFRARWRAVKHANKVRLADRIARRMGVSVDPNTLFDVQVKRFHEYKRQHLNVLHVLALYLRLKQNPRSDDVPRTVIFGGKAAPGYFMAKLIIELVNAAADLVNHDRETSPRLKVVFYSDFNVKHAEFIYPAADLSEQISLAGTEASGTGNMKFAFNGALTVGTLDGANIEIREEVGAENFFLFGLTADEVRRRKAQGYRPRDLYEADAELRAVIDLIASGALSHGDPKVFAPLVQSLLERDEYLVLADFAAYLSCQRRVSETYRDADRWTKASILNVARIGKFSSDRAVREYCRDIWHVDPLRIAVEE
jgi:starch phosphorylase